MGRWIIFFSFSFSSPFSSCIENSWRSLDVWEPRGEERMIKVYSGLSRNNHKWPILPHPRAPDSYQRLSRWTVSFTFVINNFGAWCHSIELRRLDLIFRTLVLIYMIMNYNGYKVLYSLIFTCGWNTNEYKMKARHCLIYRII